MFHFTRVYTGPGVRYIIMVKEGNVHLFTIHMAKKAGKWVIVDENIPGWVVDVQPKLATAILEHSQE